MNNLNIRPIANIEVDALRQIAIKTFRDAFDAFNSEENMSYYVNTGLSKEQLTQELQNSNSEFYFAEIDSEVIGYLKLNFKDAQQEFQHDNSLEVQRIYIDQAYQGQQIGQSLLDFSFKRAQEESVDYIWLGVWEHNPGAIRFYEKNGFSVFDKHSFLMLDDVQTDLLMKLELK